MSGVGFVYVIIWKLFNDKRLRIIIVKYLTTEKYVKLTRISNDLHNRFCSYTHIKFNILFMKYFETNNTFYIIVN